MQLLYVYKCRTIQTCCDVSDRTVEDQWSAMVGGKKKDPESSGEKRRLHFSTTLRDRQVNLFHFMPWLHVKPAGLD